MQLPEEADEISSWRWVKFRERNYMKNYSCLHENQNKPVSKIQTFLASPIASEKIFCDSFHFHLSDKTGFAATITTENNSSDAFGWI